MDALPQSSEGAEPDVQPKKRFTWFQLTISLNKS